jgi:hypothetical protein
LQFLRGREESVFNFFIRDVLDLSFAQLLSLFAQQANREPRARVAHVVSCPPQLRRSSGYECPCSGEWKLRNPKDLNEIDEEQEHNDNDIANANANDVVEPGAARPNATMSSHEFATFAAGEDRPPSPYMLRHMSALEVEELSVASSSEGRDESMSSKDGSEEGRREFAEAAVAKSNPEMLCPITNGLMYDPVVASDGHSYESFGIRRWFAGFTGEGPLTSPVTGLEIGASLVPNHNLRMGIERAVEVAAQQWTGAPPPPPPPVGEEQLQLQPR